MPRIPGHFDTNMGRRKHSDVSRLENFGKEGQDRPTKRPRNGFEQQVEGEGTRKPGKENQPVQQMSAIPGNLIVNNMKSRFRLMLPVEKDSDSLNFSGTHPDILKSSLYEFQLDTGPDCDKLGKFLEEEKHLLIST